MKYRIHGAHAETGNELSTTIDAPNQKEAEKIAAKRGILVSDIEPKDNGEGEAIPDQGLPLRPGRTGYDAPAGEPQFRFRKGEAFTFGFFAGWGAIFAYIVVRCAEVIITLAMQGGKAMNGFVFALLLFVVLVAWVLLVILPIHIARCRRHPYENAITILALAGFVIPILWLGALVWAVSAGSEPRSTKSVARPSGYAGSTRLDFDPRHNRDSEEDAIFRSIEPPEKNS